MSVIRVVVEGQTEYDIANRLLIPHIAGETRYVQVSILMTRRVGSTSAKRGGVASWKGIRRELVRHLSDSSLTALTTMFDLYGFPSDAPGMDRSPRSDPQEWVRNVEARLVEDLGDERFRPFLALHEAEAWVLAAIDATGSFFGKVPAVGEVRKWIADCGGCPELVNGDQSTAPSRRLVNLMPDYRKLVDGPPLLEQAGLPAIRDRCPHLDDWLTWMEGL